MQNTPSESATKMLADLHSSEALLFIFIDVLEKHT